MNPTIRHIIQTLSPLYGAQEAQEMAYWIVEEVCHLSRMEAAICNTPILVPDLDEILGRLQKKEPIQYIFGHTEWMGLDIRVTPATLIPRPETAELVEWIGQREENIQQKVIDLGTGSGCIAIALKQKFPQWQVSGLDISEEAIEVARLNALQNHADVAWRVADVLSMEQMERADIVVSNPPYITEKEKENMDANVWAFEPNSALFVPNSDPLLFYRAIAEKKIGKRLYFEVNEQYSREVGEMLRGLGYKDIAIKTDMYGKERMVFGRMDK